MNGQLWWFVARATGIVAWALLTLAVIWGLLLRTRVLAGRPTPRWLLDLHRFLSGLAVVFLGLHVASVVADSYVHFGPLDVLVPLAAGWHPVAVAAGVVAMYLLVAVEVTSLVMRRIPKRWWRAVHLTSFLAFFLSTLHAATAGTERRNLVLVLAVDVAVAGVLFLTLVRVLAPRAAERAVRPAREGRTSLGTTRPRVDTRV